MGSDLFGLFSDLLCVCMLLQAMSAAGFTNKIVVKFDRKVDGYLYYLKQLASCQFTVYMCIMFSNDDVDVTLLRLGFVKCTIVMHIASFSNCFLC